MTTRDYTHLRDDLEQLVGTDLAPHGTGSGPATILNLLANPAVWDSFAEVTANEHDLGNRYATVMLGLAIDADEYLGEMPPELRTVAGIGFWLLGVVERIHTELHDESVSYASVRHLEMIAEALPGIVDAFKRGAAESYRDGTWNRGAFKRPLATPSPA